MEDISKIYQGEPINPGKSNTTSFKKKKYKKRKRFQEGDDIFIDIVTIDDSGKTDQIFKHDISHAELENLVQQIKTGRGLILDADI